MVTRMTIAWMMARVQTCQPGDPSPQYPRSGNEQGCFQNRRTLCARVLAEVLRLVLAPETLGLHVGGGTTGELLVEADDTLHADSIGSSADGLK